jgi:transglutaminase-like putative cysteine protease
VTDGKEIFSEMNPDMLQYLQPTPAVDSDNPAVIGFAQENSGDSPDPVVQAVKLYRAVRDGIRYDPYLLDLTLEGLRASTTLRIGRGWCVAKAILLAACCRAVGIPARLGYADVRNHLSTARMREQMKTDVFFWHGYTSIFLDNAWVKATPAFNIELCEKFKIRVLDFDGRADSLYHPFDLEGNRHMEYLRNRGEFADVPLDQILDTFRKEYPNDPSLNTSDFDKDVEQETPGK